MAPGELVYLDYAATAPVLPEVAARMAEVLAMPLGNASSSHAAGRRALELIETARAQVAALVGAQPVDIIFTSGATESNNLAIHGTRRAAQARGATGHVVTLATEHKSVLEPVRAAGAEASVLRPDAEGVLHPDVLAAALRPDTCLVSLLHVNNETGTAQNLDALREVCAQRGVPLHVDAAQSAGKLPVDVQDIALLSISGHKLAGPQGIGALYVSPAHRGRIAPQILGSSHERGLRAGTLATHQIVGFGLACEIALRRRAEEAARLTALRERLWQGLADLPGVLRNGRPGAPHILNVSFPGVEGESLFTGLSDVALSTGSACNSRSAEPSYVLRALGRDTETAQGSLRFSLGHATTARHIDAAIAAVRRVHGVLWNASPARPEPAPAGPGQAWVGEAGAMQLGTWVRFTVQVEGGLVREARARWYGCPDVAAACSLLCEKLRGHAPGAAPAGTPQQWLETLQAPIEKLGRMLIIEDALHALRPVT